MTNWFVVGKIVNTHGVKGEIRVISSTDFVEERYAVGTNLMIKHEGKKEEYRVVVSHHRRHKSFDLLQFEGYAWIHEVELFKGATLYVAKEQLKELEENEFYYHEVIGCSVMTEEGVELGHVKEIIETGANDVWIVEPLGDGKDILLPYIEEVIKEINIDEKIIRVHLMDGLVE